MKKNMRISVFRNRIFVLAACFLLCGAAACGSGNRPADVEKETGVEAKEKQASFEITDLKGTPSDYSNRENWMEIPEITHEVDTIYFYPTSYLDDSENQSVILIISRCETGPGMFTRIRERSMRHPPMCLLLSTDRVIFIR